MRAKNNFHGVETRNYNEACEYPKLSTSSNYIINFEDAEAGNSRRNSAKSISFQSQENNTFREILIRSGLKLGKLKT